MTNLDMNNTQNNNAIRVLDNEELEQVSGGLFWTPLVVAVAVIGAVYAYHQYKRRYG